MRFCWLLIIVSPLALAPFVWAAEPVGLTHGPMLGRPSDRGIRVWARTARPAELRVRYGRSAQTLDQLSAPVSTTLEHDHTGWIALKGLRPETQYHYRMVVNGKDDGTFEPLA